MVQDRRSGPLARRWYAECLGRIDQQVKIRGYRIELKEIEHVLLEHPEVQAATVLASDGIGSETRLVAHVVAAAGRSPKLDDLREFLKARLPGYMIPASFLFLERMPVNAHGKVDRTALRAIDRQETTAGDASVAPRHATEKALADIWIDLLKVENIGVTDNFFDLGGYSLLAGQVLARVANAFGVSLPIKAVSKRRPLKSWRGASTPLPKSRRRRPSRSCARWKPAPDGVDRTGPDDPG